MLRAAVFEAESAVVKSRASCGLRENEPVPCYRNTKITRQGRSDEEIANGIRHSVAVLWLLWLPLLLLWWWGWGWLLLLLLWSLLRMPMLDAPGVAGGRQAGVAVAARSVRQPVIVHGRCATGIRVCWALPWHMRACHLCSRHLFLANRKRGYNPLDYTLFGASQPASRLFFSVDVPDLHFPCIQE